MADFLGGTADIDEFERAASAFPDISLDGSGDIPTIPSTNTKPSSGGFSFDDFDDVPGMGAAAVPPVTVTGNDEIEKFENEFPEIEVPTAVQVGFYPCFFAWCDVVC